MYRDVDVHTGFKSSCDSRCRTEHYAGQCYLQAHSNAYFPVGCKVSKQVQLQLTRCTVCLCKESWGRSHLASDLLSRVLGSTVPCFFRNSNEIYKGFSRVQHVTQQVVIDIVPQCGKNACPLPDLQTPRSLCSKAGQSNEALKQSCPGSLL